MDGQNTTIWAQFRGVNPNQDQVEINVRQTVFYPAKTGMNFITVRGFYAARRGHPWAPPAAEQIGLIGTHWSKGWIIENNRISHSACCGVALGKYGDQWDNKSETAEGYVQTIQRALQDGWSKQNIGHHVVRNNLISHCGQAGVVGSLGAAFSLVTGNTIHDIHVRRVRRRRDGGHQVPRRHRCGDQPEPHLPLLPRHLARLDGAGARVSGNLFHDNPWIDLFVEVDHGPFLVNNNIFLSPNTLFDVSHGGAYVHNLFAGSLDRARLTAAGPRSTSPTPPSWLACTTFRAATTASTTIFLRVAPIETIHDAATSPVDGRQCVSPRREAVEGRKCATGAARFRPGHPPGRKGRWRLPGNHVDRVLAVPQARRLVTTGLLGKAAIPNLPVRTARWLAADDRDRLFRPAAKPSQSRPGPFEHLGPGRLDLKVW